MLSIEDLAPVCGHHFFTDALFVQAYNLLFEGGIEGKIILEICCGEGDLAGWLAQQADAQVVAMDTSDASIAIAKGRFGHLTNLTFICGDATNLSQFAPDTFDAIVGQATMHHLANNLPHVSREYRRVLKPGGKLLFIFEPLGHNPIVAAVRAMHTARGEWIDESNLFEWALRDFATCFTRYEIYYFSLFAYFCKGLPKHSRVAKQVYRYLNNWDQKVFRRWPRAKKYAANFNVCYWK